MKMGQAYQALKQGATASTRTGTQSITWIASL